MDNSLLRVRSQNANCRDANRCEDMEQENGKERDMTAAAFIIGLVLGTGFGFIVCAVLTHDTRQREMYEDTYYIEENDM